MGNFQLNYTGQEINEKLGRIDSLAKKSELPTKVSDLTNDAGFVTEEVVEAAITTHNASTSAHTDIRTAIDAKADLSEGSIFIEGSGTTDSSAKTSTWLGTSDKITNYYDGLTIRYKIGVAGQSTTTLNINGLGAKTVYLFNTTKLTTQFPVKSIIHLIYHADLNSGCWICSDYDSNTNTYQRVYPSTNNIEYPITSRYNTTTGSSYYAEYGRYSTGVTLNPSTNTITATKFKGALTGNADTATKATQDGSGNVITSTYETKADATTKLNNINSQISQLSSEKVVLYSEQTLTEEQKAQARENIGVTGNKWAGKIASFLGDSITRGKNSDKAYPAYLQELVGFSVCNSYGISGSTISNYYEAMCNRVSNIDAESDIVFVFGGTNDFQQNIAMGEWYTLSGTSRTINYDKTTFRGALTTLCKALIDRFPNKTKVLMTPLHRYTYPDNYTELEANSKGLYLEDYVNAIKEAGRIFSIPVIDLYGESGLFPISNPNASVYFHSNDRLHPNATGHKVIADVIRGFLDRTYPMYGEYVPPDEPVLPSYTNLVPTAEERILDGDKANMSSFTYNGVGYSTGARLSSSGYVKSSVTGITTGFIEAHGGDVICIGGIQWGSNTGAANYVCAYKSDYSFIGAVAGYDGIVYSTQIHQDLSYDLSVPLTRITLKNNSDIAFIRVCCDNATTQNGENLIITRNQEIT